MIKRILSAFVSVLLAAAPAFAQSAALTRIGVAGAVHGRVQAIAPQAKAVGRIIESGKELYLNDRVSTDGAGRLQIMLLDQTVFTIGPNSIMKLDEFVYDPNNDTGKVSASIIKGIFRFITGKVARKDPSTMKVHLPVGTVGIRGTIVAGKVETSGRSTVILMGPGAANNAGERAGSFSLENAGTSVLVTEPGYGSHIDGAGSAPSAPAPVPQQTLNEINGALAPPPAPAEKDGSGSGSTTQDSGGTTTEQAGTTTEPVGDQAGQTTAEAGGSLETTQSIGSVSQSLTNTTQTASQTTASTAPPGFADGASLWDQVRTVATGVGTFSASGAFTLTQCSGTTCIAPSSLNNWNYNVSVDFASRQISGTAQINAYANNATVVDNHTISMNFASLSGSAAFCCTGSGATYNFVLLNSNGFAAKQLKGDASYDNSPTNPGSATIGTGATLTSTRP